METWDQLSIDALLAAEALHREGYYRSCVSRAYYAAYCSATALIETKTVPFPLGRKIPSHEALAGYMTCYSKGT